MKAKTVIYQRLYNLGNFAHEKIGIELEVEDGETAKEALIRAKDFCHLNTNDMKQAIERALNIVDNPDSYTGSAVKKAQEEVDEYNQSIDLPF